MRAWAPALVSCLAALACGAERTPPGTPAGTLPRVPGHAATVHTPTEVRSASATSSPAPSAAPAAPSASAPSRASAATVPVPHRPFGGAGPRAVLGKYGVVVSAEPLATRAGTSVLEAGGNAVDAAVATALVLAVTHPSAGNLGGGGFALIRPPGGSTSALDFRETAPQSLTRPDFDRMIAAKGTGPVAPGVPGSVAGLLLAERRFGTLPLERVFAPAIALAGGGFLVGRELGALLAAHWPALRLDPAARAVFGDGRGRPLRAGARLVQTDLARTLERVVALGEAGFYAGATADSVSRATAGHLAPADLAAYRAVLREPLRVAFRGLEVETMPPPSTGGVVLAGTLLGLERLEPTPAPSEGARELHLLLELSRRAQALRRFHVVDPDGLGDTERRALLARFLEPSSLLRVPIDEARATPSARVHPLYTDALRELEHTTHLSVVDARGMVVSLTTTLSASFGAKIMVPGAGVLLGNAVASFSSMGDNQPLAGRRTTSSMAPTLVLEGGAPRFVLGTPGGDTIPSTLAELILRLVDSRMPLDAAVDAARVHNGFVPDVVRYEAARPPTTAELAELKAKGHHLFRSFATQGDASVIALTSAGAAGYADPREGPGLALAAGPPAKPRP